MHGEGAGRWYEVRRRGRNVFAVALTLVGVARFVGFYSGVFPLSVLGAQFGASPLPLVFSKVQGVETYSRRFAIDLATTTGVHVILPGDASFAARIGGPFTRIKTYVDELAFADLSGESHRQALLRHMLCGPGPIPASVPFSAHVEAATLILWSANDPGSEKRFQVRCIE